MKNNLTSSFLAIFLFFVVGNKCIGQTGKIVVFNTYEEYKNENGTAYDGDYKFFGYLFSFGDRVLIFTNKDKSAQKKKTLKIKLNEIWGFTLNDLLMRVDESTSCPHYLVFKGDLCYYENGLATLIMLKTNGSLDKNIYVYMDQDIFWGKLQYFSKSIDSEMYEFSTKNQVKEVMTTYPEYKDLFECMYSGKNKGSIAKTRECVRQYASD